MRTGDGPEIVDAAEQRLFRKYHRRRGTGDASLLHLVSRSRFSDTENLLDALSTLEQVREELDGIERVLLDRLRTEHKVSWRKVGEALKISRQGAERRFLRVMSLDGNADRGRRRIRERKSES
ncbi:hypothetical protein [Nocardiopsis flavescens]|uniref:hypothetical protein n=1 Tax=Nocardiopsis flavescens TaxID=758803 RepID=UPI0011610035|nr:hypothetical protein [Nocardiopsis flavescens]